MLALALVLNVKPASTAPKVLRNHATRGTGPPSKHRLALSVDRATLALSPLKRCVPMVATLLQDRRAVSRVSQDMLARAVSREPALAVHTRMRILHRAWTAPADTGAL